MFSSLALAAALAPAAPVPKDAPRGPVGPPPKLAYFRSLTTGTLRVYSNAPRVVKEVVAVTKDVGGQKVTELVEREVTVYSSTSKLLADYNPAIVTADGTKKTPDDVSAMAKEGLPVLVSSDGNAVDPAWLRILAPNAVVIAAPELTGVRTTTTVISTGLNGRYPTTQPPTLAQVTGDPAGKPVLQVPPLTPAGAVAPGPAPAVTSKPLDEVKFEAFDAAGKAVPREDALKRARATGAVLIAADTRMPDAKYLAAFGKDVLVIVAPDLRGANPATGVVRPLPANAAPLPAVIRPAIKLNLVPAVKPVAKPAPAPEKE